MKIPLVSGKQYLYDDHMSKNYRSELVGVFGCPVEENPTGVMEEAGFKALDLDWRYITVRVEEQDLEDAIKALKAWNMRGINLTIPHKINVLAYLDELSPAATISGAVNTIVNKNGMLWGDNTDGKGFVKSLVDEGISLQGTTITILGAGGAARAIAVECALAGATQVHVINRSRQHGEDLVRLINDKTPASATYIPWTQNVQVPPATDILIQGTNIGLFPDTAIPDIDYESIKPTMVACDVVFNPPMTGFLQNATDRGLKTINGLGMLVNQGAVNFTLWTGKEAPYDDMYKALKNEFK